ncbi:phytanoyl-CoA dioxygenase family protein [Candidatus Poriferisodalis sp.]|uniref:phytanoyl-CoA dioxygenase family protein n=1 Tax=Candidatus Poriferisodalis sp. TaxID=3101277 RepID=UPI003B019910
MAELARFTLDSDESEIAEVVRIDGAAIIDDAIGTDLLERLEAELRPWIDRTPGGLDEFSGRDTTRTGALVARSPACRELVMHDKVIAMANRFLEPYTNKIQLHLTQVINIKPGQGTQPLHRDRLAWGGYVPSSIEPQFNTMWALTDFTPENGGTRIVPGSPGWDNERRAVDHEKIQAAMGAGSVLLYSGSVIHGGGENRSDADRTGINITYTLSWLRTEENQFLSCPPEVAKDLDPQLADLLGYSMGNYALGYYSDPGGMPGPVDLLTPEIALGRKPASKHSSPALATPAE